MQYALQNERGQTVNHRSEEGHIRKERDRQSYQNHGESEWRVNKVCPSLL